MIGIRGLARRLGRAFDARLAADIGAWGLAELVARVGRLATTVVVARWLMPSELGVAAAALTAFELVRTLANNGIGQAVVRAGESRLEAVSGAAWRAGWVVCLAVASLQLAVAAGLGMMPGWGEAGWMVAALAGVYLLMPPGLVCAYRLQREGRVRDLAAVSTAQALADCALTLVLALAGMGAWAVVLPKLLTAPVWLIGMRMRHPWRYCGQAGVKLATVLSEGAPALGSEVLATARMNLDKLLVGAVLGADALGIYWFVFNAGLGISQSLTGGLAMALLPHFSSCVSRAEMLERFDRAITGAVLPMAALIAVQALAAPIYVPLVFGARWEGSATLVAMLCASALSKPGADAAAQLLRAAGLARWELGFWAGFTAAYLAAFAVALPLGLPTAVAAVAVLAPVLQLGFVATARVALAVPKPSAA